MRMDGGGIEETKIDQMEFLTITRSLNAITNHPDLLN
jgi:hypothetical protein